MKDWIVGSEEKFKDGESRYKEQPLLAASKDEASHPLPPPPRAECRPPWRGHDGLSACGYGAAPADPSGNQREVTDDLAADHGTVGAGCWRSQP